MCGPKRGDVYITASVNEFFGSDPSRQARIISRYIDASQFPQRLVIKTFIMYTLYFLNKMCTTERSAVVRYHTQNFIVN